uniref:Protein At-4/1 n=1 Tax=Ananas comosus var. bracteatus TaxID=296719 RepID=A0A6V7P9W3_ANACO|nr:unnamed protein product [Ananas comosus var. bracteatus]
MGAITMSDEAMESLLRSFDQISQGYKDALAEIQSLRLTYSSENRRCEALETTYNGLKIDNERLRKLYAETLFKFANHMKCHIESRSLKSELEKANCRLLNLEEEHKRTIAILKQENELKIHDIANQLNCSLLQREADEATIKQLQLDLAARESHITTLSEKLGQVTTDVDTKLKLMKIRQAEQLMDSVSIHHVEILKQKIMKLRKENESLKRQLLASEFNGAGN